MSTRGDDENASSETALGRVVLVVVAASIGAFLILAMIAGCDPGAPCAGVDTPEWNTRTLFDNEGNQYSVRHIQGCTYELGLSLRAPMLGNYPPPRPARPK